MDTSLDKSKAVAAPHRPSTPQNQSLHTEDSGGTPIRGSKFYEHDENEVPSYGENAEIMQSLENLDLISTKEALALHRTASISPDTTGNFVAGSSPPVLARLDSSSSQYSTPEEATCDKPAVQTPQTAEKPKGGFKKSVAKLKGAFSRSKKTPIGRTDSKIDLLSQKEALGCGDSATKDRRKSSLMK